MHTIILTAFVVVLVMATAAIAVPLTRTPQTRLLEVLVVLATLLLAPKINPPFLGGPWIPFGVGLFLLGRLVRTMSDRASISDLLDHSARSPAFGAHAFYSAPLLALCLARCWSSARGADGFPWTHDAFLALFAVLVKPRARLLGPYLLLTCLILSGSGFVAEHRITVAQYPPASVDTRWKRIERSGPHNRNPARLTHVETPARSLRQDVFE